MNAETGMSIGRGCAWFLAIVGACVLLSLVGFGLQWFGVATLIPINNAQTHATQKTIGYIQAANQACEQDKLDWQQAKTDYDQDQGNPNAQADDQGQMNGALSDCRQHLNGVTTDEINPDIRTWLNAHGGI